MTAITTRPKVSLIVAALLPKLGIGYKGQMPWSLKKEMAYFRKVTTKTSDPTKKNIVIMGRKTYESIPTRFRPLKGRINFVLTRDPLNVENQFKDELETNQGNLKVSSSLEDIIQNSIKQGIQVEEIFIIGGAEIYNQLLSNHSDIIDRIFLTEIRHAKGDGITMDTFINIDCKVWKKSDNKVLVEYLKTKDIDGEITLAGNEEEEFKFDFTLWEKN